MKCWDSLPPSACVRNEHVSYSPCREGGTSQSTLRIPRGSRQKKENRFTQSWEQTHLSKGLLAGFHRFTGVVVVVAVVVVVVAVELKNVEMSFWEVWSKQCRKIYSQVVFCIRCFCASSMFTHGSTKISCCDLNGRHFTKTKWAMKKNMGV